MKTRRGNERRVVITGWGAVTPLGPNVAETWESLITGTSGIGPVTCVDASDLPTSIAGEVKGFDAAKYLSHKQLRRMDPYSRYAFAAADEALTSAKFELDEDRSPRTGVLIGSGYGAMSSINDHVLTLENKGPRRVSPHAPVMGAIDSAALEISLHYGITGPSRAMSSACASGADAIGEAARWIRHGMVDTAVAGGAEHIITRVDLSASGNAKALSRRMDAPTEASRPFDTDRDGFVMSAGSAVLVLETEEAAVARGAPILAELAGYASTSDAHHITAPHPEGRGVRAAMRGALADAGLNATDVDYVNAHGTSTPLNDPAEVESLHAVLGGHAGAIPVSSTKSMTGHMIGAAGAIEAVVSGMAIQSGIVPPTINCHDPIDTSINFVAHEAQQHHIDVVMSNSFGFGGHNAVLVLRRWEG